MINLTEHEGGGGWLSAGWHEVTVMDYREFKYDTGSDGVEFFFENDRGLKAKGSFCLKETILWRLAQLAVACGLTEDQRKHYDHKKLLHKSVKVQVIPDPKNSKYHVVDDWVKSGTSTTDVPTNPAVDRRGESTSTEDDIPF